MQYLKLLNSKRDFSKDVDRIKAISSKIDNKLSDVNNSDVKKLKSSQLRNFKI